jgi:hypothetical protein
VSWSRRFDDPIPLPKGKPLVTLRDAATYITKLPEAEQNAEVTYYRPKADQRQGNASIRADTNTPPTGPSA